MSITSLTYPSKDTGAGYESGSVYSLWTALHNPILFTFQRKDSIVSKITISEGLELNAIVAINSGLDTSYYSVGDVVYIGGNDYIRDGAYEVISISNSSTLVVKLPSGYSAGDYGNGYMNNNSLAGYYFQVFLYSYLDSVETLIAETRWQSLPDGRIFVDVAEWLRSTAAIADEFDFTTDYLRDTNIFYGFTVKYRERFTAEPSIPELTQFPRPFYWVQAAKQLQDEFGQNMARYVSFLTDTPAHVAKWLTKYSTPLLFYGYPFSIDFIVSEDFGSKALRVIQTTKDINGNVVGLAAATPVDNTEGVYRFKPNQPSSGFISLKLQNQTDETYLTEELQIKVSDACPDFPIYLKWINSLGGWSYYLFAFDQSRSLVTGSPEMFAQYVTDYETAQSKLEFVKKTSVERLTLGADSVSLDVLSGLKEILDSPRVEMLMNPDTWETDGDDEEPAPLWQTVLVNVGTFALEKTRSGKANIEFSIQLQEKTLQAQ